MSLIVWMSPKDSELKLLGAVLIAEPFLSCFDKRFKECFNSSGVGVTTTLAASYSWFRTKSPKATRDVCE